jgi:hypothetical protein
MNGIHYFILFCFTGSKPKTNGMTKKIKYKIYKKMYEKCPPPPVT